MVKKVIAINDLAGFGRCALTTNIGVLSALGIQTCPVAVNLFSSHMALNNYCMMDTTDILQKTINQWSEIDTEFDCIYTGFLSNKEQIKQSIKAIEKISPKLVLVDPVMGDNGKAYEIYTDELRELMKKLCKKADIITPNITEFMMLLDLEKKPNSEDEIKNFAEKLYNKMSSKIILTGIDIYDNKLGICIHDGENTEFYYHKKIDVYYPGTGDLFTSAVLGFILNNISIVEASRLAANFVFEAIEYTGAKARNNLFGVEFEPLLHRLNKYLY